MKDFKFFYSNVYKRDDIVNGKMRRDFRFDRVFGMLVVILFLGTVSVFAGNVLVSEEGIVSTYFSSSGNAGVTQNVSYENGTKVFVIEDGLIVFVDENVSEGNENESSFPSNGLVSYYPFDESSGDALDSFGSNNGTISGVSQNQAGKIGTAYDFTDASSDKINYGTSAFNYAIDDSYSFSFWIKPNLSVDNSDKYIIQRTMSSSPWNGYSFYYRNQTDTKLFSFDILGSGYPTYYLSVRWDYELSNSQWYHIVVTKGSGGADTDVKLYVNDVLQTQNSGATTPASGSMPSSLEFAIGGRMTTSSWGGILDEVGIWNRTLNSSEISDLYNDGDGLAYE
ncbi:LamG domain-containing protein [archaeon]|nr:LamG domain-containing protein [archaeon]